MAFNEGAWDRMIRIVLGLVFGYVAWITWPATAGLVSRAGMVSLVSLVIAIIALVTGAVGWCAVYALFGISTNKRTVA